MSKHTPGLLAIAAAVLLAFVGPQLDAQSAATNDAINAIGERQRAEIAAKEICGPNAAFEWEGKTLQCFNHTGSTTLTAKVTP